MKRIAVIVGILALVAALAEPLAALAGATTTGVPLNGTLTPTDTPVITTPDLRPRDQREWHVGKRC